MDERSTLEILPNELLLNVFENLPIEELYKAFHGLNSRLTNIINSFQTVLFEQKESEYIDDTAFANRITTLIIRHSNPIDLSRYPNLRALKLQWPSRQQCDQTMHQTQLEHLHIGHELLEHDTARLIAHTLANGFPQLNSCHLDNSKYLRSIINENSTTIPTLRSIKILTFSSNDIIHLLKLCPNLIRLSVKFFSPCKINLNTIQQYLSLPHKNLRKLTFDSVSEMSIESIDSILTFVPNLTYLSINNPHCRDHGIDIKQMASILHQHAPQLSQFHTTIWLSDLNRYFHYSNNNEIIQSLHPLFNQIQLSAGGSRLIISSLNS